MKTLLLSLTLLFALAGCSATNSSATLTGASAFDQPEKEYRSFYE